MNVRNPNTEFDRVGTSIEREVSGCFDTENWRSFCLTRSFQYMSTSNSLIIIQTYRTIQLPVFLQKRNQVRWG